MNKQDRELIQTLTDEVRNGKLTDEEIQMIKGVSNQMEMIQTDLQATVKQYKILRYRIEAMAFLFAVTSILILFKWYV